MTESRGRPNMSREKESDVTRAVTKTIRTRKEDSAFVYAILESHEGICSYSTLDHEPGSLYRDLELSIPIAFVDEVQEVLQNLGDLVYELKPSKSIT